VTSEHPEQRGSELEPTLGDRDVPAFEASDEPIAANTIARAALVRINPDEVLRRVDEVDLRPRAGTSAMVAAPIRQLQRRRDVAHFATTAPIAAVKGVIGVLAEEPLEKIVDILGASADEPTYDELSAAIDQLLRDGASVDDIIAVLAYAIVESFPAAEHCRRLLGERVAFALPDVVASVPVATRTPKEVLPEIRDRRRARREEEKQRKRASRPTHPARPTSAKREPTREPLDAASTNVVVPTETRRDYQLTPREREQFDPAHAMVGAVVLVDVVFDARDPAQPEITSKERPALVVGGSVDALLVRPIYSNESPTRQIFQAWRRIGLDHLSYIEDGRFATLRRHVGRSLGRLTVSEWNALI
jgi:hypothetical protein